MSRRINVILQKFFLNTNASYHILRKQYSSSDWKWAAQFGLEMRLQHSNNFCYVSLSGRRCRAARSGPGAAGKDGQQPQWTSLALLNPRQWRQQGLQGRTHPDYELVTVTPVELVTWGWLSSSCGQPSRWLWTVELELEVRVTVTQITEWVRGAPDGTSESMG